MSLSRLKPLLKLSHAISKTTSCTTPSTLKQLSILLAYNRGYSHAQNCSKQVIKSSLAGLEPGKRRRRVAKVATEEDDFREYGRRSVERNDEDEELENPRRNYRLRDHPRYVESEVVGRKPWRNLEEKVEEEVEEDRVEKKVEGEELGESEEESNEWSEGGKLSARSKILDSKTYDLSADEFDLSKFIHDFNQKLPQPLDECNEDLSYFGRGLPPTYNFGAYADKSELIQEYVKLGVKLYKAERNPDHMRALLSVDLDRELPVYVQFLHDCGVPADSLGEVITRCPMILKEDMDDMKTRIRYLRAHNFSPDNIARIVTKNPFWLTWATKHIDERLGHFQNEFKLKGNEVRFLTTKQPQLITYNYKHIYENTFAVREEMGFSKQEEKVLLLAQPKLWMMSRTKIVNAFYYLHNKMNLTHLQLASNPGLLTCRESRIKNRHEFLVQLKRDQFDPSRPGYVSPISMVMGSDAEFCEKIAKSAVETYNMFLKTR